MSTVGISPWFSYTDRDGTTVSIHIPNLFDSVNKLRKNFDGLEKRYETKRDTIFKLEEIQGKEIAGLKKKIKDLEAKIAQNREYTTEKTRGRTFYGGPK